jgi:hypothetical protein
LPFSSRDALWQGVERAQRVGADVLGQALALRRETKLRSASIFSVALARDEPEALQTRQVAARCRRVDAEQIREDG